MGIAAVEPLDTEESLHIIPREIVSQVTKRRWRQFEFQRSTTWCACQSSFTFFFWTSEWANYVTKTSFLQQLMTRLTLITPKMWPGVFTGQFDPITLFYIHPSLLFSSHTHTPSHPPAMKFNLARARHLSDRRFSGLAIPDTANSNHEAKRGRVSVGRWLWNPANIDTGDRNKRLERLAVTF